MANNIKATNDERNDIAKISKRKENEKKGGGTPNWDDVPPPPVIGYENSSGIGWPSRTIITGRPMLV